MTAKRIVVANWSDPADIADGIANQVGGRARAIALLTKVIDCLKFGESLWTRSETDDV